MYIPIRYTPESKTHEVNILSKVYRRSAACIIYSERSAQPWRGIPRLGSPSLKKYSEKVVSVSLSRVRAVRRYIDSKAYRALMMGRAMYMLLIVFFEFRDAVCLIILEKPIVVVRVYLISGVLGGERSSVFFFFV